MFSQPFGPEYVAYNFMNINWKLILSSSISISVTGVVLRGAKGPRLPGGRLPLWIDVRNELMSQPVK